MNEKRKDVFVYIICEQINVEHGPVKVGISDNPWYRAYSLSAGNPRKLAVYRVFSLPTRRDARELELLFHTRNSEYRVHGEWFNRSPEKAGLILEKLTRELLESIGFAGAELQEMIGDVLKCERA